MRTFILIALVMSLGVPGVSALAAPPYHVWSQRLGGTSDDQPRAVAVDGSGNVVVTGEFYATANFGGGDLVSLGSFDVFVAKYDANGVHEWSQRFGGTNYESGGGIAVDGSGNVYVTGSFSSTANFGGGDLVSSGVRDIFVAKYDASGAHQWSQRFGGTEYTDAYDIAVDGSGNAVVTGDFSGTTDFGGGDLVSSGFWDIFVAKYDANGAHQWSQRFGGTEYDGGSAVAVDGSGSVVVTGYFDNNVDFGGGTLTSAGSEDIFVTKYDANGVHQWSQRFGGTGGDYCDAVAVDGSGNVVVTGYFQNSVDFGGGTLISAGSEDIFVAKYDANGVHQWSRRFGGTGGDYCNAVAVLGSGNVVATGIFQNGVDFGGGTLMSAGFADIFVAKYDANGVHQWSRRFGSTGHEYSSGVAVNSSANLLVTGEFQSPINFGGADLVSAGYLDGFLVSLADEQPPVPVLISRFDATARRGGVELTWELSSDETLGSFTLNRGRDRSWDVIATGDARTTSSYTDASVEPGATYQYELVIRTSGGDAFVSPRNTVTIPTAVTTLAQNFPNPFNPQTTIEYTLGAPAPVSIDIFDVSGALVRRLDQGVREAGSYRVEWDGRDTTNRPVAGGVYFYRLSGVNGAETRRMVLIK